jgi:hypothetical protein
MEETTKSNELKTITRQVRSTPKQYESEYLANYPKGWYSDMINTLYRLQFGALDSLVRTKMIFDGLIMYSPHSENFEKAMNDFVVKYMENNYILDRVEELVSKWTAGLIDGLNSLTIFKPNEPERKGLLDLMKTITTVMQELSTNKTALYKANKNEIAKKSLDQMCSEYFKGEDIDPILEKQHKLEVLYPCKFESVLYTYCESPQNKEVKLTLPSIEGRDIECTFKGLELPDQKMSNVEYYEELQMQLNIPSIIMPLGLIAGAASRNPERTLKYIRSKL